ncbi:Fic family protein [Maribacter polysaccharolyticus]|uniref:Fic family protein n=1 Tax=Maribacter polysaccharolyticus TaxID=3020831 RepID=UPI00237F2436|nr:Fic family protein [Maribacter polysaccharolyticus]MDE3744080.1 Fic family protein [Maribacter polysaccharolyticus]
MPDKDPFIDIRKKYDDLLSNYREIIVASFSPEDFRNYNEILFSAHSCGIEGNSFSVNETRELKEKGYALNLVNKTLLEAFELMDHFKAYSYLMNRINQELNEDLIKETHKILTQNTIGHKGHVPGEYAKTQMAAGDTIFRDTKKAIANMPKLLDSFNEELKKNRTHPLELSAIFHQMFIYSHPFPDGNGRLGRLISNFILERYQHPHVIILSKDKDHYINALKASEKNNSMEPIITFFYKTSMERMETEISQKKNLSKNFQKGISRERPNNNGIGM